MRSPIAPAIPLFSRTAFALWLKGFDDLVGRPWLIERILQFAE